MPQTEKNGRRRGDHLENDIYEATYHLLLTEELSAITFSKIAKQANTSRSVLYRYWESPFDLLFQTIMYEITNLPVTAVNADLDEGSLRKDLFTIARWFLNQSTTEPFRFFRLIFANSFKQQNLVQLQQLNEKLDETHLQMIHPAIENALRRHELMRTPAVAAQLAMFNLLRYQDLMNGGFQNDQQLNELLDQVIIPALVHENE